MDILTIARRCLYIAPFYSVILHHSMLVIWVTMGLVHGSSAIQYQAIA